MHQVQAHALWLGHAGDGRDPRRILDAGIKAVVHLAAEEPTPPLPRELIFVRFPLMDGPDSHHLMLLTLGTVSHLLKTRLPTLLYCSAGMSRSPAIAAGALAIVRGSDLEACLREVLRNHPADVSPGLWDSVRECCQRITALAGDQFCGHDRSNLS